MQDGQFMIPCIISNVMFPQSAWAWQQVWVHFLLAGGAKGKRFALPNAEIMIHQPSGGAQGQATDIKIVADKIIAYQEES